MFGTLKPSRCRLEPQARECYDDLTCGLCLTLGSHFGPLGRALVGYDALFTALLAESLMPSPAQIAPIRCPLPPWGRKRAMVSVGITYASALQVLLADQRLADWEAEGRRLARALRRLGRRRVAHARDMLAQLGVSPEPLLGFERRQAQLEGAEPSPLEAAAPTAEAVGYILGQISRLPGVTPQARDTEGQLDRLGHHLGRAIYLLDALEDLEADWRSGAFNPCLSSPQRHPSAPLLTECRLALLQDLDDAEDILEGLSLVRHGPILLNVVRHQLRPRAEGAYNGAWALVDLCVPGSRAWRLGRAAVGVVAEASREVVRRYRALLSAAWRGPRVPWAVLAWGASVGCEGKGCDGCGQTCDGCGKCGGCCDGCGKSCGGCSDKCGSCCDTTQGCCQLPQTCCADCTRQSNSCCQQASCKLDLTPLLVGLGVALFFVVALIIVVVLVIARRARRRAVPPSEPPEER